MQHMGPDAHACNCARRATASTGEAVLRAARLPPNKQSAASDERCQRRALQSGAACGGCNTSQKHCDTAHWKESQVEQDCAIATSTHTDEAWTIAYVSLPDYVTSLNLKHVITNRNEQHKLVRDKYQQEAPTHASGERDTTREHVERACGEALTTAYVGLPDCHTCNTL